MGGDGKGGQGREGRVCLVLKLPLATPLAAVTFTCYLRLSAQPAHRYAYDRNVMVQLQSNQNRIEVVTTALNNSPKCLNIHIVWSKRHFHGGLSIIRALCRIR